MSSSSRLASNIIAIKTDTFNSAPRSNYKKSSNLKGANKPENKDERKNRRIKGDIKTLAEKLTPSQEKSRRDVEAEERRKKIKMDMMNAKEQAKEANGGKEVVVVKSDNKKSDKFMQVYNSFWKK